MNGKSKIEIDMLRYRMSQIPPEERRQYGRIRDAPRL